VALFVPDMPMPTAALCDTRTVASAERLDQRPRHPSATADTLNTTMDDSKAVPLEPFMVPLLKRHYDGLRKPGVAYDASERRFWASRTSAEIKWLIDQLDSPTDAGHLWAISGVLSSILDQSLPVIIRAFEGGTSPGKARALLSAISGIDLGQLRTHKSEIDRALRWSLRHSDPSVRIRAVSATSVYSASDADAILLWALESETDPEVHDAIVEELEDRD